MTISVNTMTKQQFGIYDATVLNDIVMAFNKQQYAKELSEGKLGTSIHPMLLTEAWKDAASAWQQVEATIAEVRLLVPAKVFT